MSSVFYYYVIKECWSRASSAKRRKKTESSPLRAIFLRRYHCRTLLFQAVTMVKEGSRIGIIPKICIPGNISNVQTLPLEPALQRKIGIASIIPFTGLPPAASAFAELTKKWTENNIKTVRLSHF